MINTIKTLIISSLFILYTHISYANQCTFIDDETNGQEIVLDRIAAIVNEQPIMLSELNDEIYQIKQQVATNNISLPSAQVLCYQVLNSIINRYLELQFATNTGIRLDNQRTEQELRTIRDNIIAEQRATSAQQQNLTEREQRDIFNNYLTSQGTNLAQFREKLGEEIILNTLRAREVSARINISESEIEQALSRITDEFHTNKEYKLETILINLPSNPSPEDIQLVEQRAQSVIDTINGGVPFEQLANNDYELLASSATIEGISSDVFKTLSVDYQPFYRLPDLYQTRIMDMTKGEIVKVNAPNGIHIIKLVDVRSAEIPTQGEIHQDIFARKFAEQYAVWITELKESAHIEEFIRKPLN